MEIAVLFWTQCQDKTYLRGKNYSNERRLKRYLHFQSLAQNRVDVCRLTLPSLSIAILLDSDTEYLTPSPFFHSILHLFQGTHLGLPEHFRETLRYWLTVSRVFEPVSLNCAITVNRLTDMKRKMKKEEKRKKKN